MGRKIPNVTLSPEFKDMNVEIHAGTSYEKRHSIYTFTLNQKSSNEFFNSYDEVFNRLVKDEWKRSTRRGIDGIERVVKFSKE